ncbi:MAG: GreA/GreB family elongation factor [Bacteroidota bacterium]
MKEIKNKLILLHEDYTMLKAYIRSMVSTKSTESNSLVQLEKELLKDPVLVDKTNFPEDGVCLNSEVTVQDNSTGRKLQVKLVLPEQANLRLGRISVFAPMGTALIGYRKGQLVKWQMPGGRKELLILDVLNARC